MKKVFGLIIMVVVALLVLIVAVIALYEAVDSITRVSKTRENLRNSGWLESETVREAKEMYENGSEDIEVIEKLMELFKGVEYKEVENNVGVESIVFEESAGNCMAQSYTLLALIKELGFDYDVKPVYLCNHITEDEATEEIKKDTDWKPDHVILQINNFYCDLTRETRVNGKKIMSSCLETDLGYYTGKRDYKLFMFNFVF